MKAKGKNLDHRKAVDGERGLNEYSFDCCFPGDEFGYRLTVLLAASARRGDRDTVEGRFWEVHDGQGDEVLRGLWRPGWRHPHQDGPGGGDRVPREEHRDREATKLVAAR